MYRKLPCRYQEKFNIHAIPSAPQTARSLRSCGGNQWWHITLGAELLALKGRSAYSPAYFCSHLIQTGIQQMPITKGAMILALPHCSGVPPAIVAPPAIVNGTRINENTAIKSRVPITSSCQNRATANLRAPSVLKGDAYPANLPAFSARW